MRKFLTTGLIAALIGLASPARAQFCPGCIQNSGSPQDAQINIGTATIRGTVVASTGTFTWASIAHLTVTTLSGNGAAVTSLNASNLASGVVAAARIVGSYTGITGVGTLTAGLWNGTVIGTQYGGTGQNWVTKAVGHIPFFSTTGTMSTLAPDTAGKLLQTNGASAPSWTGAPSVLGTNVTGIPLANLQTGALPTAITVADASLSVVSAAKVSGNIAGGAAFLTVPLPIGNLAAGQLPTSNPASSVTASGVTPGTYGGPIQMAQVHVNSDGRIDSAAQYIMSVPPTLISSGSLPSSVTIAAEQISTGTLHNYVIASSVAANGVTPGSYGDATRTVTEVIGVDGRVTSASQQLIAIAPSQINAGALPSNVTVPATSISAGALSNSVVASSLTNSGVTPGTYGGLTQIPALTVGLDGRVTSATQHLFPQLSTNTVANNIDNAWNHSQTSLAGSSWTFHGAIDDTGFAITASTFAGSGAGLTFISPFVIGPGALPSNVIASSVGVSVISDVQVSPSAAIQQSKISGLVSDLASKVAKAGDTMTGSLVISTSGPSVFALTTSSGVHLTAGVIKMPDDTVFYSTSQFGGSSGPCSSSGTFGVLCQGEDNHLSNGAGVPNTHGVVAGGQLNVGNADGNGGFNVISGGYNNVTSRSFSTISGGRDNTVGYTATIGGGISNAGMGDYATVAGGNTNIASGNSATVAGGASNTSSGSGTAIGGGGSNVASASNAAIAGGVSNHALHTQTFIGGGQNNYVTATFGAIAGGQENTTSGQFSFIGGGFQNSVTADVAAIASGDRNSSTAGWAYVGGGKFNVASGVYGAVLGGITNVSSGPYTSITGGEANTATTAASYGFVGGGTGNALATSAYNTIAGGRNNSVSSNEGFVGGGDGNQTQAGNEPTIAGGKNNTTNGNYTTIAGGIGNTVSVQRGFIGGGDTNSNSGDVGVIGGGTGNSVTATGGSVLGGQNNSATAIFATAGGGQTNAATGPYSVVAGGGTNSNSNSYGVIAGGNSNTITLTSFGGPSVIGGGLSNAISNVSNTQGVVIAGGSSNTGGGAFSTVSGGAQNDVPGAYSVVPGGSLNRASGDYSYAAGRRAKATAQGSFALSDSQNADLTVVDTDTLHVRFQGGANFEVGSSTFTGILSIGSGSNVIYYCSGSTAGTFDGNLARGNGNAGACAGGTWVATSLHTD